MRQRVTLARLDEFMRMLGTRVKHPARVFLVGGASAVLLHWRDSTIDIDLKAVPEDDALVRELSALKERLGVNIELASPDHFIPELPGWQERSQFIRQEGKLTFLHYDFYAQALAKIERAHEIDLQDIQQMIATNLVEPNRLPEFFSRIESDIPKYPALDAPSFRRRVQQLVDQVTRKK